MIFFSFAFIRRHFLFFCILAAATFLRFHDISRQMIFIGDQGRDFFVARSLVKEGKIPLLGIPSSIPRFAQGPLYIYFLALTYWVSGGSVLATGLLSAGFGIANVVAAYLFVGRYVGWKQATVTSFLLALFPMLLLHSRMPYHINPIPFFVIVYLWQLMRLWEGKKWSLWSVAFSFALVFQFELAAFPLFLLIPAGWYLREKSHKRSVTIKHIRSVTLPVLAGLTLGLAPQVLYDVTHHFSQLGGFIVWVGYRIVSALLPFGNRSLVGGQSVQELSNLFSMYLSIFTQNTLRFDALFWAVFIPVCIGVMVVSYKKYSPLELLAAVSFALLSVSFIIHHVPSEAYMPLVIPSAAICIASVLCSQRVSIALVIGSYITYSLLFSLVRLERTQFFLLQPHESDWTLKRFGPSIQTQRLIVNRLYALSKNHCISLESKERDASFPNLFNHIEYLLAQDPDQVSGSCVRIGIDRPDQARKMWQNTSGIVDLGAYWIQIQEQVRLYATKISL